MRVPRLWRTRSLLAIALVAGIVGGRALGAQPPRQPVNQPVTATGELTYLWHGDPSHGCAAAGLCGVRGSLTVRFDGFGTLFSIGRSGSAELAGASATARVRREGPGAQPGECVDLVPTDAFGISIERGRTGGYSASLDPSSVSSGRCAGPLGSELARLRFPISRLPTRGLGFDLHGQVPFSAGPFTGELISTVVLRPDTSTSQGFSSTSSSGSMPGGIPPHSRTVLIEYANVRYRIDGPTGALTTTFAGDAEPFCEPLDACGVSGSLSLSIPRYHDSLSVSASIVVHRRVGRRRALADLSAGRLGLDGFPVLDSTPRALVSETLTRAGAAGCGDTRGGSLSLLIGGFGFRPRAGVLPMLLATGSSPDPLRTHCPGPSTADVSGAAALGFQGLSGGALGQGSLALRDLGDRQIVISLGAQGRFFGEGYSGTRGGTIRFSLTLLRAGGGTRKQRIG